MSGKKNKTSKINRCCGNFEKSKAQRKRLQDALAKDVVKRRSYLTSQMQFICARELQCFRCRKLKMVAQCFPSTH